MDSPRLLAALLCLVAAPLGAQAPQPATAPQNAAADVLTLPLDLHLGRYLYVRGTVNGTPTDIVVDSGAGITVVDRQLADTLGLERGQQISARGAGGDRPVHLSKASVRIGDLELADLRVAILDLEDVHSRLGRRMPVILGKELFHGYPVTVDYPARELRVHRGGRYEPASHEVACRLRPVHQGHMMAEIALEDLEPIWCVVDTGSADTLALNTDYVEKQGLLQRYARLGEARIGGVGGSLPAKLATATKLAFAGVSFRDVPITLAIEGRGAFGGDAADGNIGSGLLGRFVVTFDYANERMLLAPGPNVAAPFAKDRLGLALDRVDGKLVVTAVAAGSPAAGAGFASGDTIAAVDGVEATLENALLLRRAFQQAPGTTLVIRDGAGKERSVELAEYF